MKFTEDELIADIIEEHLEAVQALWGQRQEALASRDATLPWLVDLEARIEAHVQGLLIAGGQLIPLVQAGLGADEAETAFAAAYPLLRLDRDDARPVLDRFCSAEGAPVQGLKEALCHGPAGHTLPSAREVLATGPPPIAVAAAEVLAFHSPSDIRGDGLRRFLTHDDATIRRDGWRIASLRGIPIDTEWYEAALADEDAGVRREALQAAAWARQDWILGRCRAAARDPGPESLQMLQLLAILGRPEDLELVRTAGRAEVLGWERFGLLGAYGHPRVVDDLLDALEGHDPRSVVAAGQAFTTITGCDIDSGRRTLLPPEDGHEPDEFEREFLDEANLPSSERARAAWSKLAPAFADGSRWCRGLDLSRGATTDALDQLDLASRGEAILREHFDGRHPGCRLDLETFPMRPAQMPQ